jgi:hypothetical protein
VNGEGKRVSELQSYSELDEPEVFLDRFFAKYPTASTQILASEDVKFFINICQRPGQKPVPFIPVLDSTFSIWFKKVREASGVLPEGRRRTCIDFFFLFFLPIGLALASGGHRGRV